MKKERAESTIDGISMVGFRLNPDSEGPDLFTLIAYGERDFPIEEDGQIIFFSKPGLASQTYERFTEDIKGVSPPPSEVDLVCDVAGALHLIEVEARDESAIVLNCLNTFFDLVESTGRAWPSDYEGALHELADHLTFHKELSPFLDQQVSRSLAIDALLWCIGVVTAKAKLVG